MDKPHPFQEVSWAKPVGATHVTHYRDGCAAGKQDTNYGADFYSQYKGNGMT